MSGLEVSEWTGFAWQVGDGMRRGSVGERTRRARYLAIPGADRPACARQMREAFLSIDTVHAPRQPNDFERSQVSPSNQRGASKRDMREDNEEMRLEEPT